MLVITRKVGEGISLGVDIHVCVLEVRGGQVRIGIDAPRGCRIFRDELVEKIRTQNEEAAAWTTSDLGSLAGVRRRDDK